MKERLRICLLIDHYNVPSWVYELIKVLSNAEYAVISLVAIKKIDKNHSKTYKRKDNFLELIYSKLERKIFRIEQDPFQIKNLSELVFDIPVMEISVLQENGYDYVNSNDLNILRAYDLDVCIKIGFNELRGAILNVAKSGIWVYNHSDSKFIRGGPPGTWEVITNTTDTGCELKILNEEALGETILVNSWSSTKKTINRNRYHYYWKSIDFLPRKLKELYEVGENEFRDNHVNSKSQLIFYSKPIFKKPSTYQLFLLLLNHGIRLVKLKFIRFLYIKQWILLFAFNEKKEGIEFSLHNFKRLVPPKDRFWSDPFIIRKEGRYFVFVEEFLYKHDKGHISVIELDRNGVVTKPKTVLEKPYHLSYPFVFSVEEEIYMIPETARNNTIEIYKSASFPYRWELQMILMNNVNAADTTILFHDNKYWMFTLIAPKNGPVTRDELYIFHSNTLLTGSWTAHKKNPVVSDVKRARSAGRIFHYAGKMYRPSQDCSIRYGNRILFNEIIVLNESEYQEEMSSVIEPDWSNDLVATHTFAHEGQLTIVDALLKRSKYIFIQAFR